ncbi:MAG: amidohydrolase family protein [Sedimentisphaerales bacterium]|nr:amidohydrolase family protein [Sedimentisphaerales bacterium]
MLLLHAHTVFPVASASITDGAVVVDGHQVVVVGPFYQLCHKYSTAEVIDLTGSVLLPGLVNAHTHLELTHLKGLVPYDGDFRNWLECLTNQRRATQIPLSEIIAHACRESLESGVTTVGDICFQHQAWQHLAREPIRKTCFAEVFNRDSNFDDQKEFLQACIRQTRTDALLRLGLSPHSPYSAGPHIYQMAGELSQKHNLCLTTHLAETPDEGKIISEDVISWKQIMMRMGRIYDSKTPGRRPVDYFLNLDQSERAYVLAHVNYLDDDELSDLARSPHSVAFCPRSHDFFGHAEHRFREMMDKGINVCLGTDSLASNQSLSILEEIRFLHRRYPDLPGETMLKMATINGARALAWDDKTGSITPGLEADLIAVPLTNTDNDPFLNILESHTTVKLTMVRGTIIFKDNEGNNF